MPAEERRRILFDISFSMRWTGPPVGIVRVERKLALWACTNMPNVEFVFFDPGRLAYCRVTRDVRQFLTGEAAVDTFGLTNPALPGGRRLDRIPAALKPAYLWISQSQRMALGRLERLRLGTQRPWLAGLSDRLQRPLMSNKYRSIMIGEDAVRRPFFPYDMAVGERVEFRPDDTLICVGSGWGHTNIEAIGEMKSRIGFRMVLLLHDLIPVMFPHFYPDHDVALFGNYMRKALAIVDRIVVNSRRVEADCRAYCAEQNIVPHDIVRSFFGFDVGAARPPTAVELPGGLAAGSYAMLVSTIEPRKGHRLMVRLWRRLMAEGVPQSTGFKLVFVGRPGWGVDDLLAEIRDDSQLAEAIRVIADVVDDHLAMLYGGAAFCLYPSAYEGYGLPLIEAFSHGKAVLVSTGGALPELAEGFSPCLDLSNEEAWYRTLREWIERPQAREPYEREILTRFRHPTWAEAAANFFASV